MTTMIDRLVAGQDQLIELMTMWQKPVVAAVARTAKVVEGQAAKLPKLPAAPFLADLPKPSALVEVQLGFAAKLMDANRRFVVDLAQAVEAAAPAGPSTPADES